MDFFFNKNKALKKLKKKGFTAKKNSEPLVKI